MERLLLGVVDWILSQLFPHADIVKNGRLYLRRWFVRATPNGNVYIHRICQSDHEDPHDHPWSFTTRILWRGYTEELTHCGRRHLLFASWLQLNARDAHRVHRVRLFRDMAGNELESWSLVRVERYRRRWYFYPPSGPVFWRTYLNFWGKSDLDLFVPAEFDRAPTPAEQESETRP